VTPWVVQVDRLGPPQGVAPTESSYQPTDPQIAFHLARFVEDRRKMRAGAKDAVLHDVPRASELNGCGSGISNASGVLFGRSN
jgi:type IV secretory pathway TrbF-like protein